MGRFDALQADRFARSLLVATAGAAHLAVGRRRGAGRPARPGASFGVEPRAWTRASIPATISGSYVNGSWGQRTVEIPADRGASGPGRPASTISPPRRSGRSSRRWPRAAPASPATIAESPIIMPPDGPGGDRRPRRRAAASPSSPRSAPPAPTPTLAARNGQDGARLDRHRRRSAGCRAISRRPSSSASARTAGIPTRYVPGIGQGGLGMPKRDYYLGDRRSLAAHPAGLSRASRHDARPDRRRRAAQAAPRAAAVYAFERAIAEAQWPLAAGSATPSRPTIPGPSPSSTAGRRASTGAPISAAPASPSGPTYHRRRDQRDHRHRPLVRRDAAAGAQGLAHDPPRQGSRAGAAPRLRRRPNSLSPAACSAARPRRRRAGCRRSSSPASRSPTPSRGPISSAISRPRPRRRWTSWSATSSGRWTARLANLDWMAPETRTRARAKLAAFTPMIGYPDSVAQL